jgi:hypothetical protein
MWWHTRSNQISSFGETERLHLNRQGASVLSTTDSRGVRISGSNAGYTMLRGSVKSTGYPLHPARFPLHFPNRTSQCVITFQLDYNTDSYGTKLDIMQKQISSLFYQARYLLFQKSKYRTDILTFIGLTSTIVDVPHR